MTVQQLIDRLKQLPPGAEIEIPIQTYTRKYPSVYVQTTDWNNLYLFITESPADKNTVRIHVNTPEGVIIVNKNK